MLCFTWLLAMCLTFELSKVKLSLLGSKVKYVFKKAELEGIWEQS